MNNYFPVPVKNADTFFNKNYTETTSKDKNCFPTQEYKENCSNDVMFGYHKPLNESCSKITGHLNKGPDENCTSLWNNMTRRKTLIKDY